MHPIEYLRFLAREGEGDPDRLVPDAADALAAMNGDRRSLVLVCRKLIEHQPACGPLWWLCGRALTARDLRRDLEAAVRAFLDDTTELQLSLTLTDTDPESPPEVLRATMVGPSFALVRKSGWSGGGAEGPGGSSRPAWVTAGVGATVPERIQNLALEMSADQGDAPSRSPQRVRPVPLTHIDQVIRPTGAFTADHAVREPDVTLVPELLPRG